MEAATSTIGLRDLHGPSALSAGGWRRFWRVLWQMTKTDFQLRYSQPALGYIWPLLGPMIYATVLYIAFTRFLRFGGEVNHYAALLIFNILTFQFFVSSASSAARSFVGKQNLTRKVEFPMLVVPLASVASNFISYLFNMVVAFGFIFATGVEPKWTWLFFPLLVLAWLTVASVTAVLLASVYLRFRDVTELWNSTQRAMFYASPVIFPIEIFPERWHFILQYNPVAPILAQGRVWIIDADAPTYAEALGGPSHLLIPLGLFLLGAVAAIVTFRRAIPRAAER